MPIPPHAPGRFLAGVGLPFRGLATLARERRLWRYALLPVLLSAVALVASLILLWPVSAKILGLIWAEPSGVRILLWGAAHAVLFLVLALTAAAALPGLLAAPFTDKLSAEVEALELGTVEPSGGFRRALTETRISLAHAVMRTLLLLAGHAALLALLVVPVLGMAYPILAFLWSASWLAFDALDIPMARHLQSFSTMREALRRVRPLSIGFGGVLALAFLVPLAGFLVVPVSAVAGTHLYCDLVRSGMIPR